MNFILFCNNQAETCAGERRKHGEVLLRDAQAAPAGLMRGWRGAWRQT